LTLTEALSIRSREVVSLVGAGGKTTLMFALGRELSVPGKGTLLTTTTKIWDPEPADEFALFLSPRLEKVKEWIGKKLGRYRYLLVAAEKLDNGKLQGIPPNWISGLFSIPGVSYIVIEADGAAGRPLKAPREGEPVIPEETTLLIPVVGIDALGKPLHEDYVFRSRIAAEILDQPEGAIITEKMIAKLVIASLQNMPENARVVPFLNKVDLPDGVEKGKNLARVLMEAVSPRVEKVVLGNAQGQNTVAEIIPS
jgi:probable selenium-dependent hydroxylase accessory protein YqeC